MKNYLKKLNWSGFLFMVLLCMIGVTSNESVTNLGQWMFMMVFFGLPIATFFLFAGKED